MRARSRPGRDRSRRSRTARSARIGADRWRRSSGFTGIDTCAKWLVLDGMPTAEVVFVRYLGHLALVVALRAAARGAVPAHRATSARSCVRGGFLLLSTILNFAALWLPAADHDLGDLLLRPALGLPALDPAPRRAGRPAPLGGDRWSASAASWWSRGPGPGRCTGRSRCRSARRSAARSTRS